MNIPREKVAFQVREILSSQVLDCPIDQVTDSSISSLDSIGRITLLVELENHFGVELTGEDYDVQIFSSMDALADFVAAHLEPQK